MGKHKEAFDVLKRMARINKAHFKADYTLEWMRESSKILNSDEQEIDSKRNLFSTISEIFYPCDNFLKMMLLFLLWNALSLNYVGVSLSVTSVLKINPYVMFGMSSLFEFLGAAICHFNQK